MLTAKPPHVTPEPTKLLFRLFDSFNRNAPCCCSDEAPPTPNFDRIAQRGTVFDTHYDGSPPCMPPRRDLLTDRLNFLHRSWGSVKPCDDRFTQRLPAENIYTHLISDHYHYWEEGGCGYHNQYSSAEFVRGQERDLWKAMVVTADRAISRAVSRHDQRRGAAPPEPDQS